MNTKPSLRLRFWETSRPVLWALLFATTIRVGIAQAYVVEGSSMLPTLSDGDRVLVQRSAYGLSIPWVERSLTSWALPYPGDVVIIRSPEENLDLLKRVVGLPGDVIELSHGHVYRNGQLLVTRGPYACPQLSAASCRSFLESNGDKSYRVTRTNHRRRTTAAAVRVPAGHVYILGDHRDGSNDSRAFGPVSTALLRGRLLFEPRPPD